MIPVADSLTHEDTLPGREIKFGIGDPRWMMRSAAKLYSDVTTAIIREYSTNAADAHLMAGNSDPIEVTLPSDFSPVFIVEDKGVGMNVNDFEEIYTQFGISNKRDSNSTNGVFGFGSKSGIAYTNQFQVTSIKDGIKTSGIVMRKPDWEIVLKIVSESRTDEPNGTRISIPVHNVSEFNAKANDFYRWWMPGTVMVNGSVPKSSLGRKIVDGFYTSTEWNRSRVVMGNVAYRINNPEALFRNSQVSAMHFVAFVDSGAVEFTPSREDLEYTDATKAVLQEVVYKFEREVLRVAKEEIDSAKTHAEAYAAWKNWTDTLGTGLFSVLEFKGDKFQSDYPLIGQVFKKRGGRGSTYSTTRWNVESTPKTIFVTEFNINLASLHKSMVKEYAELKGWDWNNAVFTTATEKDIVSPWIDRSKMITVSYADMKAALPKKTKTSNTTHGAWNSGRIAGSWDYIDRNGYHEEKSIPNDGELYWISTQSSKAVSVRTALNLVDSDAKVIIVPANRHAKFVRENPKVETFVQSMKKHVVKDGASLLSDDAKAALCYNWIDLGWANALDLSKIDDPAFKKAVSLAQRKDELTQKYYDNIYLAQHLRLHGYVDYYEPKDTASPLNFEMRYPLAARRGYNNLHPHIYLYINAVYAAESESKND